MAQAAHRTWVEVSKSALLWNFGQFKRFFGDQAQIAPVVKANAYGHDVSWVVKTLSRGQFWGFCVAYGEEAMLLKSLDKQHPILVLSAWQEDELPRLIRKNVRLVVWDVNAAKVIARAARAVGQRAIVHVKVDTGTSRIGTRVERLSPLRSYLAGERALFVEGVFSHFADSESTNLSFTNSQYRAFINASSRFDAPLKHIACTAASLRTPLRGTNLVRLGIGLYGLWPSLATEHADRVTLKPVLSWKTRVLQVKRVPAGTKVGYGMTYKAPRATTLAVLPVGYADGYARSASNESWVVIRKVPCPVRGRVSMNLAVVDLGERSSVRTGTEVTLIGRGVAAGDLAATWKTLHYEVVSRIPPSIPRIEVP